MQENNQKEQLYEQTVLKMRLEAEKQKELADKKQLDQHEQKNLSIQEAKEKIKEAQKQQTKQALKQQLEKIQQKRLSELDNKRNRKMFAGSDTINYGDSSTQLKTLGALENQLINKQQSQQSYKAELDAQKSLKMKMPPGNMTQAEKAMNKLDLKAFKYKIDINDSIIPGLASAKRFVDPQKFPEIVKPKQQLSQEEKEKRLKQFGYATGSAAPTLPSTGSQKHLSSLDQSAKSIYMKVSAETNTMQSAKKKTRSQNSSPMIRQNSSQSVSSVKPANFNSSEE